MAETVEDNFKELNPPLKNCHPVVVVNNIRLLIVLDTDLCICGISDKNSKRKNCYFGKSESLFPMLYTVNERLCYF